MGIFSEFLIDPLANFQFLTGMGIEVGMVGGSVKNVWGLASPRFLTRPQAIRTSIPVPLKVEIGVQLLECRLESFEV